MDRLSYEFHLESKEHEGRFPNDAAIGMAGGAPCGDLVVIALTLDGEAIASARFDAKGCGAARACASVTCEMVEGRSLLDSATITSSQVAAELGSLSSAKVHAAGLAADALHEALSELVLRPGVSLPRQCGRALVAMSGGVDSAVAAKLMADGGAEVVAVTLKLWDGGPGGDSRSCCSPQAVLAARSLAHGMGLAHFTLDMRKRFRESVVTNYLEEYGAGRTPSPCVRCNGALRFDAMLGLAGSLGAEKLVTGHYARIVGDGEGPLIAAARHPEKDQSYMLCALQPSALGQLHFPLSDLSKDEVRKIAREAGLEVSEKPESQDLCFAANDDRDGFFKRHWPDGPGWGEIVDREGNLLGMHGGHHLYTVGQRRGLGVSASAPYYVISKDAQRNRVVVGPKRQLRSERVVVAGATLYRSSSRVDSAKLRYRQRPVGCTIEGHLQPGTYRRLAVRLHQPDYAVAPGQVACLLEGEKVVGWGIIESKADAASGRDGPKKIA